MIRQQIKLDNKQCTIITTMYHHKIRIERETCVGRRREVSSSLEGGRRDRKIIIPS